MSWADLDWIRELWDGPIVVKGVLRPAEAVRAADAGVDAVIVSNHGGRQLDHTQGTIDALPAIADAVRGAADIIVDGGFTRGTDVLKALAWGANVVAVGRTALWGHLALGLAWAAAFAAGGLVIFWIRTRTRLHGR